MYQGLSAISALLLMFAVSLFLVWLNLQQQLFIVYAGVFLAAGVGLAVMATVEKFNQ